MKVINSSKSAKTLAAILVVGLCSAGKVMASSVFSSSQETSLINVCAALKSDSRIKLNQAMKSSRLNYKTMAKGLMCNGQPALDFAVKHQAQETAKLFARKGNIDYKKMLAKR